MGSGSLKALKPENKRGHAVSLRIMEMAMKMLMRAVRGHRGMYLVAAAAYGAVACGGNEAVVPWIMAVVYLALAVGG